MHLLIIVFLVSLLVLLWAAWAIAQAVRRHGKPAPPPPGALQLNQPPVESTTAEQETDTL